MIELVGRLQLPVAAEALAPPYLPKDDAPQDDRNPDDRGNNNTDDGETS